IRFVPIPGVGRGVFTESVNIISHVNSEYLQPVGLRGLLSTVPMAALVLIGTSFGDALRSVNWSWQSKAVCLLLGGLAPMGIGWLWSLGLPYNQAVWTASYVVFAAGAGALVLGAFYLLVDAAGWRWPALPLV